MFEPIAGDIKMSSVIWGHYNIVFQIVSGSSNYKPGVFTFAYLMYY